MAGWGGEEVEFTLRSGSGEIRSAKNVRIQDVIMVRAEFYGGAIRGTLQVRCGRGLRTGARAMVKAHVTVEAIYCILLFFLRHWGAQRGPPWLRQKAVDVRALERANIRGAARDDACVLVRCPRGDL